MKKKNTILSNLFKNPVSKEYLATSFDLKNTRSVENYISELNQDIQEKFNLFNNTSRLIDLNEKEIIYDKKLKKYRFNTLLPTFITQEVLLSYLGEAINNLILQEDFRLLNENTHVNTHNILETLTLSNLMQKIIQIKLSLQINYSLKIEYKKNNNIETKYINPHSLFSSQGIYYLYATYHSDNISNIGEKRTFSLNGITSIAAHDKSTEKLFQKLKGNEWGIFNDESYIIIRLKEKASSFYKREGFIQTDELSYITEEADGSILIKMYYSNEQEIINFIQKWMPYATIANDSELEEKIYDRIHKNLLTIMMQKIH